MQFEMMIKKKFNRKLNNEGFSLLEVLVAVVILTLISTALIQGFISSARTNARSKKLQDATDLAQNVAEYYGAQDLSNLKKQGIGYSEIKPDNPNLKSIYVFEYDDTTCDEEFHVITVLNPNKMEYQNVNEKDAPVFNHMYSNNSTYWMREFGRYDDDALKYIREQSANPSLKQEDIKRVSKVDIHVSANAADEHGQSKISITYNLSVDYSCTIGGNNYHKTYFPGYRLISFSSTQVNAPALYLAYAPHDLKNIACSDELEIKCMVDSTVNWPKGKLPVYLISQEESVSRKFTDANIRLADNSTSHMMEIHTNLQDVVDSGKGYPMTTGGTLDIVGEAAKNVIYQLDVYILSRDEYDKDGTNWTSNADKSDLNVPAYFTNFTTSTVK